MSVFSHRRLTQPLTHNSVAHLEWLLIRLSLDAAALASKLPPNNTDTESQLPSRQPRLHGSPAIRIENSLNVTIKPLIVEEEKDEN